MGEMLVEGSEGTIELDGNGTIKIRQHGSNDTNAITYDWRDHAFGGDCVFLLQQALIDAHQKSSAKENSAAEYLRNVEIEEAAYRSNTEGRKISL